MYTPFTVTETRDGSRVLTHSDGHVVVQTPGFHWTSEDVLLILQAHGELGTTPPVESFDIRRVMDLCLDYDLRIQSAVLHCTDPEEQIDAFFSELELILMELGFVAGERLYLPGTS